MARKQKKYHYIYKTTCNVNGKYYIGMHSTDNLEDGYLGSGKRLWHSINYYGKENFTKNIVEYCEDREELKKREKEIVNEQLIDDELCMNLRVGGDGGFVNEEHKRKFIETVNLVPAHEKIRWLRENDPIWEGKRLKNISKSLKNNPKIVTGTFKDRNHTEETRKKISEKAKKRIGEKNSQYGTCWINKNGINKKIKKEYLPDYENNGWIKGRKY